MKSNRVVFETLTLISQLGISIIVPVILCTFAGVFLEDKFSISLTVPLIILGILSGVRNAYYLLKDAHKKMEKKDEKR